MSLIFTLIVFFTYNANPPGTIKIKDYYVDKTEIMNIHWLEYVHFKGPELDSSQLYTILPDSSNFWFAIRDNRYKPIVLITYEQALDYCAWRSEVVSKEMGKKVTYRLPTPSEWKEIAEEILEMDLKLAEKDLKTAREMAKKDTVQYTLIEREGSKNRVYNMFDNVTEMTLEKGVAMGANNYELTDLKTNLSRVIEYTAPNAYLGFRCIAEVE